MFLHGEYYCASGTICAMGQRNVRDSKANSHRWIQGQEGLHNCQLRWLQVRWLGRSSSVDNLCNLSWRNAWGMLGTVLVAPTAAGVRYDTVLGRYTTESCGGTYVGQESIPMYYVRYVGEESLCT